MIRKPAVLHDQAGTAYRYNPSGLYRAVATYYWSGGSQTLASKTFCASC
jgi:hypothetical protein